MKTTLEKISGFDVLRVIGEHTWDEACKLPEQVQGAHGIDDWVLPDRFTLVALAILADGAVNGFHWSSSPYVGGSSSAWGVSFLYGYVNYYYRNNGYAVRLVRASQCLGIGTAAQKKSMKDAGISTGDEA